MSEQYNEPFESTKGTNIVEFGDHPIPVRYRRRFVDTGDLNVLVGPKDIIKGGKSAERAFYRFCDETDIADWCTVDSTTDSLLYPLFTRDIFQEELAWRAEWKKLPPLLTIEQIADHLGASPNWTRLQLEQEGISPHTKRVQRYIKSSTMFLRGKKMQVPDMPNSRSSLLEIAALHDIEELDLEMWALNNGFSIDYHIADMVLVATIPSSQVNKLIANLPKANDWISSELLSEQAGIPEAWIEKQLDIYGMPRGEMFDNDGRLLTHYPPVSLAAATFEDIEAYHRRFVETVFDSAETTALGSLFSRVAAERKKLAKIQDDREKYERTLDMTYRRIAKARNEIIRLMSRYPSGS